MAHYVLLRPSGYYFRYAIPQRHIQFVALKELRYPLSTGRLSVAKKRARFVVVHVEDFLSKGAITGVTVSAYRLRQIIQAAIEESKEITTDEHISRARPLNPDTRRAAIDQADYLLGDYREALAHSDYRIVEGHVTTLLNSADIPLDKQSPEFKTACHEYTAGMIQVLSHQKQLLNGVATPDTPDLEATTTAPSQCSGPSINDELEAFLSDRVQSREIRQHAVDEYRNAMGDLVYVLGDVAVNSITYEAAVRFRETMRKLPARRNTRPQYKGRTLDELLGMEVPRADLVSASSISQKLGQIKTFFEWLTARRVVERNPFTGVTVKSEKQSYQAYTADNLQVIFSSDLYIDSAYARLKTTTASHWWLPLLALHTGARPSELLQMRVGDIKEIDGVLSASITDDPEEGLSVKTKAGRRIFPIHPALLQLGFSDYVQQVGQEGHDRVLPGIKLGSRKAGENASKWWNERYREKRLPASFKPDSKTLYSFRHTYVTQAVSVAQIPLERVQQMVGHERNQMGATKHYDKGLSVAALYAEVKKIKFDGLDMEALKGGWKRHKRL